MTVMMVRQKVREERLEESVAAVQELFATLNRVRPEGVRYASTRVAGTSTFVILFELADGAQDPRPTIPEYVAFTKKLADWVDGQPQIDHLEVVGSFNLFAAQHVEQAARP